MSSKYADAHRSTNGPGDGRPTAVQIVEDEDLTGKLVGKVFLITGCSSGLGVETAKALATTGATLYLTARDIPAAETALASILKPGQVEIIEMDLGSLAGVRAGAERFLAKSTQLNVLICNAGVMAIANLTTTVDGFETQFGVNHLAHFLLVQLLKDTLLASSSPKFASRVVAVSSSGHRGGGIRVDDYDFIKRPEEYNMWGAYSQSKTANIYMANEIERRFGSQGLHATSLMPGAISTGIQRHLPAEESKEYARTTWKTMKSPAQGAATTVLAAIGKEFENKGGVYLENCEVAGLYPDDREYDHVPNIAGYAEHAFNEELAIKLWADSLKMIGGDSVL
ncbi:uncharacterized protein TRUGW13939_07664 [Talaromyces rugulosus]|uniref:Uncharacterized protein n=1 Tax=Talaromyces rugulosus TaxID=121627 RepID=A0A7H8R2C0_TALRU|nr:uncharacterized protein TRUGW13939_07664 [Talaromyces rugulosus]QKX60519.1 hypothetical protein TRUGW13939_07664 [Talaromyces rugulosus]